MPNFIYPETQIRQRQVINSSTVNDNMTVPSSGQGTLEADINYIRSIIKQIKGTSAFDAALIKSLDELRIEIDNIAANIDFDSVTLTGIPTAPTPDSSDSSTRIATTEYVSNRLNSYTTDANYVENGYSASQSASTVWSINHNLNKFPSVMVVDSADTMLIGLVKYIDLNNVEIEFSIPTYGRAFLN